MSELECEDSSEIARVQENQRASERQRKLDIEQKIERARETASAGEQTRSEIARERDGERASD